MIHNSIWTTNVFHLKTMLTTETEHPEAYFEVGAVSKMTGLSPNTLRTWERRNFIEASLRSPTGRRRYSQEQVERLALMKKLTNLGDSISSIAGLTLRDLRNRVLEYESRQIEASSSRVTAISILSIGELAETWTSVLPAPFKLTTSGESKPDIVIVGLDAQIAESRRRVSVAVLENPGVPIALVYDYAPRELIQRFSAEGRFLIRVPCSPELLAHYVHAAMANASHQADPTANGPLPEAPRLFTDRQLATIAASNPDIKCECPHHISALVASLASFENYCRRCEIESPQDAEVHHHLGGEIARARSLVEEALLYLCQKDNLVVPER